MGARYFLNGRLPSGALEAVKVGKIYERKIGWLRDLSTKFGDTLDENEEEEQEREDEEKKEYENDGSWALRNVNFSVNPGEKIAIFGGAGSGKSTLVGLLSGIVAPTEGYVEGTGVPILLSSVETIIMPDRSCYDNLVAICELLRISKYKLSKNLDEIIEFSELGQHMYRDAGSCTKTMYQQITMSMVLNVDPDILLIDGNIGVKDPNFSAKILKKIMSMTESGMSLLYTTRDARTMHMFDRGIVLEKGSIKFDGDIESAYKQFSPPQILVE